MNVWFINCDPATHGTTLDTLNMKSQLVPVCNPWHLAWPLCIVS